MLCSGAKYSILADCSSDTCFSHHKAKILCRGIDPQHGHRTSCRVCSYLAGLKRPGRLKNGPVAKDLNRISQHGHQYLALLGNRRMFTLHRSVVNFWDTEMTVLFNGAGTTFLTASIDSVILLTIGARFLSVNHLPIVLHLYRRQIGHATIS